MKIYCEICDKVQPVRIDNCRDAKTNEPFQDIVCAECHLVIAAGTEIRREWVGLTDEEIRNEAKDIYGSSHWDDIKFARAIEAKLREKNA